jgi:hypothetical protein
MMLCSRVPVDLQPLKELDLEWNVDGQDEHFLTALRHAVIPHAICSAREVRSCSHIVPVLPLWCMLTTVLHTLQSQ